MKKLLYIISYTHHFCHRANNGIVSCFLVFIAVGFAACGGDENNASPNPSPVNSGSTIERGDSIYEDTNPIEVTPFLINSDTLQVPIVSTVFTLGNAPVTDGSDSTEPLRTLLLFRQLGIDCEWRYEGFFYMIWKILPEWYVNWAGVSEEEKQALQRIWLNNNTHQSFVELIDGNDDLIITARGISRDELKYAEEKGVALLSCPIAKDAFVFIVNANNPVKSLTIKQIQDIYMGKITNWIQVGGNDAPIKPYIRNANSGSQEKMETVVMKGLTMPDWAELKLWTMISPYETLANDENGICYTPYYYYKYIVRSDAVKTIAVDYVEPDKESIQEGTYPYITNVVASVRSDVDRASTAYQFFYQLSKGELDNIIEESGYIPISKQ